MKKNEMKLPKAVLWDMDGTLIDSEKYWFEIETELAANHGVTWSEELAQRMVGNSMEDSAKLMRKVGVNVTLDEFLEFCNVRMIEKVKKHAPYRPGALETLQLLKENDIPCALVTMSYRPFAQAFIDSVPKDTFAVTVTGDMVKNGKPHPDPYLLAIELLNKKGYDINAKDCVAVEDSIPGATSAVAAGVKTIGIPLFSPIETMDTITIWKTLAGVTLEDFSELLNA
ncbi:MAG: HAD family phosphatase [Micrococcaceae bacterium]